MTQIPSTPYCNIVDTYKTPWNYAIYVHFKTSVFAMTGSTFSPNLAEPNHNKKKSDRILLPNSSNQSWRSPKQNAPRGLGRARAPPSGGMPGTPGMPPAAPGRRDGHVTAAPGGPGGLRTPWFWRWEGMESDLESKYEAFWTQKWPQNIG